MKDHANTCGQRQDLLAPFGRAFRMRRERPADYRDELAALARSLGLGDRLVWAGENGNLNAAYNAFDIATLSSAFGEGFPNVVGEAMACGIPVVAHRCRRRAVDHG